jgi:hypothetical protein
MRRQPASRHQAAKTMTSCDALELPDKSTTYSNAAAQQKGLFGKLSCSLPQLVANRPEAAFQRRDDPGSHTVA